VREKEASTLAGEEPTAEGKRFGRDLGLSHSFPGAGSRVVTWSLAVVARKSDWKQPTFTLHGGAGTARGKRCGIWAAQSLVLLG